MGERQCKSAFAGSRFGRLIVIEIAEQRNGKLYWLCRCDCGNEVSVLKDDLTKGLVKSCGRIKCQEFEKLMKSRATPGSSFSIPKT